jgi:hypothetical protein
MRSTWLLLAAPLLAAAPPSPYSPTDAARDRAVHAWAVAWEEITSADTIRASITATRLRRRTPEGRSVTWVPSPLSQGEPRSGAWVVHLAGQRLGMDAVEPGWTDRWVIEGADVALSRDGAWVLRGRLPGDKLAAALWGLREWTVAPPATLFDPADLPGLELAGEDRATMHGPGFDLHVGITDGRVQELVLSQPPYALIVHTNHYELNQGVPEGAFDPTPPTDELRAWFEQVSPDEASPW